MDYTHLDLLQGLVQVADYIIDPVNILAALYLRCCFNSEAVLLKQYFRETRQRLLTV